jgi:hypothetical protein
VLVTRGLSNEHTIIVEEKWTPARRALAVAMKAASHPMRGEHWDWTGIYRQNDHCLIGIECENEFQGLMALDIRSRPSYLTPGLWVTYVDFVEAAPWNRREPPNRLLKAIQQPRMAGVGTLLIMEAVRLSIPRTSGRIALHSLQGSEDFYANNCSMTCLGPDPGYYDLHYFEYNERVAVEWLMAQEVNQ